VDIFTVIYEEAVIRYEKLPGNTNRLFFLSHKADFRKTKSEKSGEDK
jgi:hypothetical protein